MGLYLFMNILAMYLLLGDVLAGRMLTDTSFNSNYQIAWGDFNVLSLNQGSEIQLSMDKNCGAGFESKNHYGSGFYHMRIKLPGGNTAGVVTAYYLTSHNDNHDELDFEFLGNVEGKPYVVQTNVFANGIGNRENRIHLWFDPTADFHDYQISWNQHQIVFYVDGVPVRVHKNVGVGFPTQPMQIEASLWDGESWATDGGKTKTDWSKAPFRAHFQGFDMAGCPAQPGLNTPWACYSNDFWWNQQPFWQLNEEQQRAYQNVKQYYTDYDYCGDRARYPTPPPSAISRDLREINSRKIID